VSIALTILAEIRVVNCRAISPSCRSVSHPAAQRNATELFDGRLMNSELKGQLLPTLAPSTPNSGITRTDTAPRPMTIAGLDASPQAPASATGVSLSSPHALNRQFTIQEVKMDDEPDSIIAPVAHLDSGPNKFVEVYWLTLAEAAAYCRVNERIVRAWMLGGHLEADGTLPDCTPRFRVETLNQLLNGQLVRTRRRRRGADEEFLTPQEVADHLRLSRSAVYRLLREIPHVKIGRGLRGGRILVRPEDLHNWLSGRQSSGRKGTERRSRLCRSRSKRAGGKKGRSGTRGSVTRARVSESNDPRAAALVDWLSSGSNKSGS
jgi:excisionase family DNA binding protein